jgi:solute carrier family 41
MTENKGFVELVEDKEIDSSKMNDEDTAKHKKQEALPEMEMEIFPSSAVSPAEHQAEPSLVLFFQVLFPFMVAGFGMVLAGIVLDIVQHWQLFKEVPETFILVPALLGLKGNLEMTLASRLSTQANTGKMETREQIWMVVITNVGLIQAQAIVVTSAATAAAMVLAWIPRGQLDISHFALLLASSLTTASLASFFLSGLMILVIVLARRYNVNPDNIATPIAASLGDLTTLGVLACFGSLYLRAHLTESWLNVIVSLCFIAACPAFAMAADRDASTGAVLREGWSPILFSMLISSGGGFVLENAMRSFTQMALFQPVINGVGGNLAAVHASRLSTFFHKSSNLGTLPNKWTVERFRCFRRAFFSSDWDARSARVLLFLVVPGHIFFNWAIGLLHTGENPPASALFTSLYLAAALAQVTLLLYICQWIVALMWHNRIDPDNAAIPYLTALGDLLGTTLLYAAFSFLSYIKEI